MRGVDIIERISSYVRRIPLPILIGAAVVFLITAVALTAFQFARGKKQEIKWGILYTDLKPVDLSKIVDELERMKIPYRVSESADTIFVPQELIPDIRNSLAVKGLPQERAGLEIFEKPKFGLTDFMQRVNYQRAVQGEIERTISKIDCVENARVHIAFPEKKLFTEQEKEPTASVMLWLTPGCSVSPAAIKGIVHLVSFAVEGLRLENITVVDQRGRILNRRPEEEEKLSAVEVSQAQIEIKKSFEKTLEQRITELLEKSVGNGKVGVKVDAEFDFTKVKRVSERYDPYETAVRSEQLINERFKGVGAVPVGPPGTRPNVPPEIGIEPLPGKSEYEREERIRNYEISKVVEHVEEQVGDLKRISVAVMVDGQYRVEWHNGKPFIKFIPMPEDQLEKLRQFVVSAVGLLPQRGDQVSVVSVPFEASLRYAERLAMFELHELGKERASMYKWIAIAAIGLFVSMYLIFKKLFERRLPQEVEVVIPKFEKAPPEKYEIPVAVEVVSPPALTVEAPAQPPPAIEIISPPVIEVPAPPPPIEIVPPPPAEVVAPSPPVEERIPVIEKPPVEERIPEEVVEVPPPPVPEKPPFIEVPPPAPEKPIVIEEKPPQIELAPPPTFEIPKIEIAAPPPLPEEDVETVATVSREIVSSNIDIALSVIKKWLSEK